MTKEDKLNKARVQHKPCIIELECGTKFRAYVQDIYDEPTVILQGYEINDEYGDVYSSEFPITIGNIKDVRFFENE